MDELCSAKFEHIEKRLDQHGERLNVHGDKIDKADLSNARSEETMKALNTTLTEFKEQMILALSAFNSSLTTMQNTFVNKQELQLSEQKFGSKLDAQITDGKWKGIVYGMVGCITSFIIIALIGKLLT